MLEAADSKEKQRCSEDLCVAVMLNRGRRPEDTSRFDARVTYLKLGSHSQNVPLPSPTVERPDFDGPNMMRSYLDLSHLSL